MSKDVCNIVNCHTQQINSLATQVNVIEDVEIPLLENKIDNLTNYSWFLETGTGPTGQPTSGPFEVDNKEVVRLWSSNVDIKAVEGSVLVEFDVKGAGDTGSTGQPGPL